MQHAQAPAFNITLISVSDLIDYLGFIWLTYSVESGCPEAYIYAYDDATALKYCPSNLQADYMITFCP